VEDHKIVNTVSGEHLERWCSRDRLKKSWLLKPYYLWECEVGMWE